MKRIIMTIILVFGIILPVFSQNWGRGRFPPNFPQSEMITISGNLIVAHGMPAIINGNITYLITGISRLSGFVDGLKEGAYVTIEGYAVTSPMDFRLKLLWSSTLILDGRTYDLVFPTEDFFPDMFYPWGWMWADRNHENNMNMELIIEAN